LSNVSPAPLEAFAFCVQDTGEGLAADKLEQLFQPFNRLGREDSVEQGTGIGLVMCKRLIDLMGGVIGVESTIGEGSKFWFELQLAADPTLPSAPSTRRDSQAQVQTTASMRTVLYVEDNPAILMLVEDLLARRPDVHLLAARDGVSGVEIARHRQTGRHSHGHQPARHQRHHRAENPVR